MNNFKLYWLLLVRFIISTPIRDFNFKNCSYCDFIPNLLTFAISKIIFFGIYLMFGFILKFNCDPLFPMATTMKKPPHTTGLGSFCLSVVSLVRYMVWQFLTPVALPLEVIPDKAQYVLVCNTEDCKKSCQFYCNDFDQQTCEHIETNTRIIQIPRTTKWSLTINENHFSMILVKIDLC